MDTYPTTLLGWNVEGDAVVEIVFPIGGAVRAIETACCGSDVTYNAANVAVCRGCRKARRGGEDVEVASHAQTLRTHVDGLVVFA